MADEADDVLELDPVLEIEGEDQQTDGEVEGEGGEEVVIGFGDGEAAPAPEGESSVIRDLRKANREMARKLAERDRQNQPQIVDPGPEPTLESCEYDEEKFRDETKAWIKRSDEADRAKQSSEERAKAERDAWTQRVDTYRTDKQALKVTDFAAAEDEVFAILPEQTQALLMMAEKPAALVYALSKNPAKLAELAKLDLTRAAMMVGKLEDKLQVSTRKLPSPDTPLRGNAALSAGRPDKELARLEKEADRTGDRTALIRYRNSQKS